MSARPPRPSSTSGEAGGERDAQRSGEGVSLRKTGGAYEGAMQAALAVVVSLGIGVWADSYFGTAPVLMFAGLGVGFGAFILRLVRLLRDQQAHSGGSENGDANG